jgi:hypothetical protein
MARFASQTRALVEQYAAFSPQPGYRSTAISRWAKVIVQDIAGAGDQLRDANAGRRVTPLLIASSSDSGDAACIGMDYV